MKKIVNLFLATVIALSVFSCGNAPGKDEKLKIVATLFPQYDFACHITGGRADVTMLLPYGSESHTYEPSVKDMTDDELRTAVNRLRLEQDYRSLNPQKVSAGKKFADTVINQVLVPAAVEVGKKALKAMLEDAVNKATGVDTKDKKKGDG
jgi:hypothetical protein